MMHAHVDIQSQDCDGRYSQSYVASYANREEAIEAHTARGDTRTTIIAGADVIWIGEQTEEGYCNVDITMCDDPRCADEPGTFRDHSAEAAGY